MKHHAIIALLLLLWSLTGCKDSSSGDKSANAPQQPSDPPSQTPPKSDEASSAVIISAGSDFIVNEDQNFRLEGKSKVTRNFELTASRWGLAWEDLREWNYQPGSS